MRVPPFLFVRHGETEWNVEGRLQGGREVGLNDRGRRQAAQAGRLVSAFMTQARRQPSSDAFIASPLGRARETMSRILVGLRLDPQAYATDPRLCELSFGEWEGLTWAEVKARDPVRVRERRRDKWNFVPPGGESYAMLADRLGTWLHSLQDDHRIVVSHGGVGRVLMVLAGGLSRLTAPDTDVPQGRVLHVAAGRSTWL